MKIRTFIISGSLFASLGFYRGTKSYNYNHSCQVKKYKERIQKYPTTFNNEHEPIFFYTIYLAYGFTGLFMYINPFFLPITLFKESKKIEIDLRKLENAKDDDYYSLI